MSNGIKTPFVDAFVEAIPSLPICKDVGAPAAATPASVAHAHLLAASRVARQSIRRNMAIAANPLPAGFSASILKRSDLSL